MKYEVKVPQVGESITEVTIGQWLKQDGDVVETDEIICEIESEKATLEIPAEHSGVLKILVPEGETVPIGKVIAEIDSEAATGEKKAEPVKEETPPEAAEVTTSAPSRSEAGRATPVAQRLMAEAGLSESRVTGTGVGGRITKEDVLRAIEEQQSQESREAPTATQPASAAAPAPETPSVPPETEAASAPPPTGRSSERTERRVRMSTLRKTIAKRLVAAKNETAMLTTFNEVDMSAILDIRRKYKDSFLEKHGVKLGFMSFFVKACTMALQEFPEVNASIDGDEIVYHDYCDISIAVSTPRGLVVPVIFDAHRMNLAEIESEVARLAQKAREGKLTIEEMTGGTFSITNGGVFGSLLSTPIINPPQTAILGMHKIEERPIALNGQVVIRPMMYVALSYDHRIIDGKESVSFLVRVKELLEDPTRLLLEV